MTVVLVILAVCLLVAVAALVLLSRRTAQLRSKYSLIIDADAEALRIRGESSRQADKIAAEASNELERLQSQLNAERAQLETVVAETAKATSACEQYRSEIALLEENLEDISFGVYKPHFDFDTPEDYKQALQRVVDKQKAIIREGDAARFTVSWTVGGSRREGERMQRQYSKLLLRAFNGECEAAIAKVAWNNATKMEERIRKSFSAINDLGQVQKKRDVIEEQRRAREQIREQERALREAEAEKEKAAQDEDRFAKAIEKARVESTKAKGEEHARLTNRILQLEEELAKARIRKERASALAELTTAGYVYVLSNMGSFGENVFKIGMTRRLEPSDRVKELSDASVPFGFDVHAMVYSENAPALETAFHKRFADWSINPMNPRKEFFRVSIAELEAFVKENDLKISFTHLPEAREYRETLARRREVLSDPSSNAPTSPGTAN